MSRYIVTPILSPRNIPYYVVTDTSTGKGVEGYGCETWAQHRQSGLIFLTRQITPRVSTIGEGEQNDSD